MSDRTQEIKNLRAVATACKGYIDNKIDDLQWQLGTYDLGVESDTDVARIKSLPGNTIKSMVDYIGGKTVKYNQLVKNSNFESASGWSSVNATLVISNNVATFTATAQYGQFYTSISSLVSGHKYFVSIEAQLTTATNKILIGINNTSKGNLVSSTSKTTTSLIIENSVNGDGNLQLIDTRTSDFDAVQVFKVILIDLTLNYGAGNEPSTVETAIPLLKANGYKLDGTDTYSTGSLKHAITTSVVYSGNLCQTSSYNGIMNNAVDKTVDLGNLSKGTYSISFNVTSNSDNRIFYIYFYNNGVLDTNNFISTDLRGTGVKTYTFTLDSSFIYDDVRLGINTGANNFTIILDSLMLVKGTTTPSTYIPYVAPITKAIPNEVLADARYGLGFDDNNYNHLDSDGHLRGNVLKEDMSTFNWTYSSSYDTYAYITNFSVANAKSLAILPSPFTDVSINNNGNLVIFFASGSFDNVNELKQALSGVYLIYQSATSFDQDYSQYFDTNWNKVDLDKQYATCEMICDEPIDMPNTVDYLIEEVKA